MFVTISAMVFKLKVRFVLSLHSKINWNCKKDVHKYAQKIIQNNKMHTLKEWNSCLNSLNNIMHLHS